LPCNNDVVDGFLDLGSSMVAAHNGLFAAGFECPTLARAGVRRRRARDERPSPGRD
jgi:hypothetical protein